jgi:hypothetical protein
MKDLTRALMDRKSTMTKTNKKTAINAREAKIKLLLSRLIERSNQCEKIGVI